jgi:hypothetical protein
VDEPCRTVWDTRTSVGAFALGAGAIGSASETSTAPSPKEIEQQNNDCHNDEDMN